jgi:hypothetical protein
MFLTLKPWMVRVELVGLGDPCSRFKVVNPGSRVSSAEMTDFSGHISVGDTI